MNARYLLVSAAIFSGVAFSAIEASAKTSNCYRESCSVFISISKTNQKLSLMVNGHVIDS